jgi:hypothetical protein
LWPQTHWGLGGGEEPPEEEKKHHQTSSGTGENRVHISESPTTTERKKKKNKRAAHKIVSFQSRDPLLCLHILLTSWPMPPRSPPPPPPPCLARWRPGGPPLSTPGPRTRAAAGSGRGRSTGCELGRGRVIRRTSTAPTPGNSPWIAPRTSVNLHRPLGCFQMLLWQPGYCFILPCSGWICATYIHSMLQG